MTLDRLNSLPRTPKRSLLVATSKRVFVISPQDTTGFMQSIQRAIEMGSLSSTAPQSVYPTFVVVQAWESLLARYLLAGRAVP